MDYAPTRLSQPRADPDNTDLSPALPFSIHTYHHKPFNNDRGLDPLVFASLTTTVCGVLSYFFGNSIIKATWRAMNKDKSIALVEVGACVMTTVFFPCFRAIFRPSAMFVIAVLALQ